MSMTRTSLIACQINDARRAGAGAGAGAAAPGARAQWVRPDIRVILVIATGTPSMDKARHVRN